MPDGWFPFTCNLSLITQIDNVIISISGVIDSHNRLPRLQGAASPTQQCCNAITVTDLEVAKANQMGEIANSLMTNSQLA